MKKKTKDIFEEFGLQLVGLLILGLLVLIFIGIVPFLVLVLVPVALLYFILEGLKLDVKVKKIFWIAYLVILIFLIFERFF